MILKKYSAWIITQGFAFLMFLGIFCKELGPKEIIEFSGYAAFVFLYFVLFLNPLKKIFPNLAFISFFNRYRREIGVTSFSCALIHLFCFIIKKGGFLNVLALAPKPPIFLGLVVALPILLLLTITSNKYFLKKLGFNNWKKIHRLVYLAEVAVFLHLMFMGNKIIAISVFLALLTTQILRICKN